MGKQRQHHAVFRKNIRDVYKRQILFYRALGVPLKQIGALMADASAGRLAALQSHRAALLCRRAQLDALLATLDKTILTEEGK